MSPSQTTSERARRLVEERLTNLGYTVQRDRNARSGRFTVAGVSSRFEVYVAGARGWGNDPIWLERRLRPSPDRFVALVRFPDDTPEPELYLVPTTDWLAPELPLTNPQYEGLLSEPEYRIRVSRASFDDLQRY